MKKMLYRVLLALFVLFPVSVLAEGYVSVSTSSLTIEQGSSKTFTISAYNTIGDVAIRSDNNGVASVSIGEWGTGMVDEKQTKSGTVTVTGNSVGTTTITLTIDAATFDGEDLAGQTKTITVNVVAKPAPSNPTPSNPTPSNPTPSNPTPQKNLSKSNNIKSLVVEGYKLVKVNNSNYTLTVSKDVKSIKINATAEDSKAKVTGTGEKALQVGENKIEVVVTSESGEQNKIIIKVTRKDEYNLNDLDSVLKNKNIQDADIIINADSKVTKEQLEQIKSSKKTLRLNYYNKNKKLVYSWTINGEKIKEGKEFNTTITSITDNEEEIYKLSNYADGLYFNFNHSGELPTGTKIKLYVGNKFENGNIVNIYHYNATEKKLETKTNNLKVVDGYVEFDIEHCSDYFVTTANVGDLAKEKTSSLNIFAITGLIVIIGLVVGVFIKIKSNKKDN